MRMYGELAEWFHLLTAPEEYADEAADYERLLLEALPGVRTLLELGSGGGNNALHLKQRFECALTDLSPEMLALSEEINPTCEHIAGDMRTLRLGRQFDAVFVHDAIAYMVSEADVQAAIETAYVHTRLGGVALFTPDFIRETFVAGSDHGGHDAIDGRGVRYLEWVHAPHAGASTYVTDYALLTRERDGRVGVVHDRHVEGLFSRATWLNLLTGAGFEVEERPLDPVVHGEQVAFICRRAARSPS